MFLSQNLVGPSHIGGLLMAYLGDNSVCIDTMGLSKHQITFRNESLLGNH